MEHLASILKKNDLEWNNTNRLPNTNAFLKESPFKNPIIFRVEQLKFQKNVYFYILEVVSPPAFKDFIT